MKHFIVFLTLIFLGLFASLFFQSQKENKPVLRVYGSSSFIAQWGPGPWLKDKFEETCQCKVEYFDGADSILLIQRLKSEARSHGADVVLGLDQYDLQMAQDAFEWKKLKQDSNAFSESLQNILGRSHFLPYDWGPLSFIVRKSEIQQLPKTLDDLLSDEFKSQLAVEDPRTSSPGLQFLLWVIQTRGEEKAFDFFKKFNSQVKAYTNSWSMANGLFQKKQVKGYFSYVTSTIYYLTQEKNSDIIALNFNEGHPRQFEYMGIPTTCRNCELAEKFLTFLLSDEGQKVIMEKNFMFPIRDPIKKDTPFDLIPSYNFTNSLILPSLSERERILKKWSSLRRIE